MKGGEKNHLRDERWEDDCRARKGEEHKKEGAEGVCVSRALMCKSGFRAEGPCAVD